MARKTKAEAQETRERLLDAAGRVFCEKGVGGTTLDDIAAAAGVTRGALYWHFRDKTDLVAALMNRTKSPEVAVWSGCTEVVNDPLGAIRERTVEILRLGATDEQTRQNWQLMYAGRDRSDSDEPVVACKHETRSGCAAGARRLFQAAIDAGQLPAHLDADDITAGYFAYLDGLVYNWLADPGSIRLEEMAGHYVDIYLAGLKHAPERPARSA